MWKAEFNEASGVRWRVEHDEVDCVTDIIQIWTRPLGMSDHTRLAFWGSGLDKPWVALWYGGKRWVIEGVTDKVIGKHWKVTGDGLPMPLRGPDLYDLLGPIVRKVDNEHSE